MVTLCLEVLAQVVASNAVVAMGNLKMELFMVSFFMSYLNQTLSLGIEPVANLIKPV